MQFVILARDSEAPGTLDKRMAYRVEHLAAIHRMKAEGLVLEAGALLSPKETMAGSLIICEFSDRQALDIYVASEVYRRQGVWSDVQVLPFRRLSWQT